MQGRRLADRPDPSLPELQPGDYVLSGGRWFCMTPTTNQLFFLNDKHQLTIEQDNSLTVSPSILVQPDDYGPGWHGYLEHGVWREA